MGDDVAKWEKIVPKRVEQVLTSLRRLTRTGAKDYEPISETHATEMLDLIHNAVAELEAAYAPYVSSSQKPAAPKAEAPQQEASPDNPQPIVTPPKVHNAMPIDPLQIARFVHQIPPPLLPSWAVHLSSRVTDEFYEAFKSGSR